MKFYKIAMICASLVMITSSAFSATSTQGDAATDPANAGAEVEVVDTDGDNFNFTPSPSTSMEIQTSATSYALTACSVKTNEDNGYHYGVVAGESAVFQLKVVAGDIDDDGLVSLQGPTDESTLPAGFEDKAGNTPGS